MATIKECDRCGEQSRQNDEVLTVNVDTPALDPAYSSVKEPRGSFSKDLCRKCRTKLSDFFLPLPSDNTKKEIST